MIANSRLTERALEQEKLRRDLALAAEVQRRLLPPRPVSAGAYRKKLLDRAANGSLLASVPRLRAGSRTEGVRYAERRGRLPECGADLRIEWRANQVSVLGSYSTLATLPKPS